MMYTLISSLQTGLQTHCKTNAEKFIHDSITRRKQTSNARVAMTLSNAKFKNNFIALYTRISRRFRVRLPGSIHMMYFIPKIFSGTP